MKPEHYIALARLLKAAFFIALFAIAVSASLEVIPWIIRS
ncbi:hypothetical protein [Edwardsiella phage GF-2]|uniref:Uncharacterized protein n=1 Tax=Edwardsiella phage GF-2 TaxID=1537091 RepID=A0A077K9V2_9CAUD|nr:hypothetical protein VC56_gp35 [Edwardsiella phage GF-2]BAP28906.1 hypothetical protein [Edwardsiella phage GF-2]